METRRRAKRLTSADHLQAMLDHNFALPMSDSLEEEDPLDEPKAKKKRTRSEIWTLFDFGTTHYYCQLCPTHTPFKRPPSTTVATRHIRRFHQQDARVIELTSRSADFHRLIHTHANSPEGGESSGSNKTDTPRATANVRPIETKKPKQLQFEALFVKMLSMPHVSLRTAMSSEMTALLSTMDAKIAIPSSVADAKELLLGHAVDTKVRIRNELTAYKSSLSATIGICEYRPRGYTYVMVTVHFVKQESLQHRFLGLCRMHDASQSVQCVYKSILHQYDFEEADIYRVFFSKTSDAASSFVVEGEFPEECDEVDETEESDRFDSDLDHALAVKHEEVEPLERVELDAVSINDERPLSLPEDQYFCVGHELKCILFDVIKRTLLRSPTYQRLLGLFEKFQKHEQAIVSLTSSIQRPFVRFVPKRWPSWIECLDFYHMHHNLMAQISIHHGWERLDVQENELLTAYLEVLTVFRSSIRTLESTESPCVSWVYGIIRAIGEKISANRTSEKPEIAEMCEAFAAEMEKRFAYIQDEEDPIFIISTFLDPATKPHLKKEDLERSLELIADYLKIDEEAVVALEDTTNPADPLLQMLDSFAAPSNDAKALVRSFSDLVCSEFQSQTEKGKYSAITLKVLNVVAAEPRFAQITQLARTAFSVPTSNFVPEEAFRTAVEHVRDPDGHLLNAKLIVHLNKLNEVK